MSLPIADYAIVGDTHTTALIASNGSIDWLCWPRHDSPALLTKLLDDRRGGAFSVDITGGVASGRRYAGETNILETLFEAHSGAATLTDFMPLFPPEPLADEGADGNAQSRVVRLLTCTRGKIRGIFRLNVTPDYGRSAIATSEGGGAIEIAAGKLKLKLTSSHSIRQAGDQLQIELGLSAGEAGFVALTYIGPDEKPPIGTVVDALEGLERTRRYWKAWCDQSTYKGAYRVAVMRSALVLKMLTYSPSGGIIAAPTTSLPEAVPGNRNFDYRYSWVRDASFTVTAFCNLGYAREAAEYLRFLRAMDKSNGRELGLLYGVEEAVPPEHDLTNLPGWNDVSPVRIGNEAKEQRQYDIYGEYMIALHNYLETVDYKPPKPLGDGLVELITNLANQAYLHRDDADSGIWELRFGSGHLQHTKALLWVALDRAVKMAARMEGFGSGDIERWAQGARALRSEYERESWNEKLGAYTQSYGSDILDAAVLRTILFGALDPRSSRTLSTVKAIQEGLGEGDLIYRYKMDDGFAGVEGAFTACAFWRVGALALAGQTEKAKTIFERLLQRANNVGLLAEEIDVESGEQRGNFPQGFTHMAIINHAVRLEKAITDAAEG